MKSFLTLIRYRNLLMIALLQCIIRYAFLDMQGMPGALSGWQFILLVVSTVAIAAGGYTINNILDKGTDEINRPEKVVVGTSISEATAYNIYVALNVLGVGIGFYLANVIEKPAYAMIFIAISGLLYLYATGLKQTPLLGNIIIACLTSMSILIIPVFELLPLITPDNQPVLGLIFGVLLDYAIFCFFLSLLREIVKDMEDVDGDYNMGMRTLPIVLGIERTAKVIFIAGLLLTLAILYYINEYYMTNDLYYGVIFSLVLIIGPMIYFLIKVWTAKSRSAFGHLSNILKLVMLAGILSILVVSYNIANHA
jgi:4-hydroxybenzoate polyprenyltransferase